MDTHAAEVDTDAAQVDIDAAEVDADTADADTANSDTALDADTAPDAALDADTAPDTALDAAGDTGADVAPDAPVDVDADTAPPVELPPRIDIHVTGFALGLLSAAGNPWDPDEGTPPTPELAATLADLVADGDWFALFDWLASGALDGVTPPDAYATLRYNDGLGWTDRFELEEDRGRTDTYLVTDYTLVVRDIPSDAQLRFNVRDQDSGGTSSGAGEAELTIAELRAAYATPGAVWFFCGDRTDDSCLLMQLDVTESDAD